MHRRPVFLSHARPSGRSPRDRALRSLALLVALSALLAVAAPASSAADPVARARTALAAATADRQEAEQRVTRATAALAAAEEEAGRLAQVDAELTDELAEARRALREYAIAAYIDGGQSEMFRATLSLEQAQALAWQSSMLLGQSVSAEDAADRFESLKEANEPEALEAAEAVDRARSALVEARNDLIQSSAFERDAESALTDALAAQEAAAAERRAAQAAERSAARSTAAAPEPARSAQRAPSSGSAPAPARPAPVPPPASGIQGNPTQWEIATLARIRRCESGGNYSIVSRSGRYRGAYQFDIPTWRSVGGSGDPAAASPAEQDYRALLLLRARGTRPWPVCGR